MVPLQFLRKLAQPRKIKFLHLGVFCRKTKFLSVPTADTELMDSSIPQNIMASADHTGMAECRSQIILSEVCMGIKMNDVHSGIFFGCCPDGTKRHQMFTAQ